MSKEKFERFIDTVVTFDSSYISTAVIGQLSGIIVQHTLFGLCIPLCGLVARTLFKEWKPERAKYIAAYTLVALILLNVVNLVAGDVNKSSVILWYLQETSDPQGILGHASGLAYAITMLLCIWIVDMFMIYRVYLMWPKKRVIALPCLGVIAELAMGLEQLITVDISDEPSDGVALAPWLGIPAWISAVVTFMTASLIIYRMFQFRRSKDVSHGWVDTSRSAILIESGAVYSLFKTSAYANLNTFASIPAAMLVTLSFLTPAWIILRGQPKGGFGDESGVIRMMSPPSSTASTGTRSVRDAESVNTNHPRSEV